MFVELPELGSVALTVTHSMQRMLGDDDPSAVAAHWTSVLQALCEELHPTTLATAECFTIFTSKLDGWDLHEVLDAVSADVANYAQLLDEEVVDPDDDGVAAWEANGILIADRVTVDPRFRGHGLGPLLLAETLSELGAGCDIAVCTPAPFELESGVEPTGGAPVVVDAAAAAAWNRRHQELCVLWARLGFRKYRDTDIFTLRPFAPEFESAVHDVRAAVFHDRD